MGKADLATVVQLCSVFLQLILWWAALTIVRIHQFRDAGGVSNYLAEQNHLPRDHQLQLPEAQGRRVKALMDHSMEQFSFLGVAVLFNIVINGPQNGSTAVAWICGIHMVLKLLHFYFYVNDMSTLRSTTFGITGPLIIAIFVITIVEALR